MDGVSAGPRPRLAAGGGPNPAGVGFEIERGARGDCLRCCDDPGDRVAHHDIATRQEALVAFRMGSEPAGEIVDLVVAAADEAGYRAMQARLGFSEAIASARDVGRQ